MKKSFIDKFEDLKQALHNFIITILIQGLKKMNASVILNCEIVGDVDLTYKGKTYHIIDNGFRGKATLDGVSLERIQNGTEIIPGQKIKETHF